MALVNQPTAAPTRKVAAGGIAGAISIILVYLIELAFANQLPQGLPSEVVAAFTAVVGFAASYFVKEEV